MKFDRATVDDVAAAYLNTVRGYHSCFGDGGPTYMHTEWSPDARLRAEMDCGSFLGEVSPFTDGVSAEELGRDFAAARFIGGGVLALPGHNASQVGRMAKAAQRYRGLSVVEDAGKLTFEQ